ncbi:PQQ-dependent sugar dehydrogenase [Rhizobium halophytocola]|uniref:Glucose/arabinose dehydrogenase n=1 Tax=Rhizobium halophytocola TaxID=735519 RepID=A0ABS4DVF5_9HYPH|nr:PQQ-dependent sugar dehydrogenase [Rhizobium halophytocola]MBP1849676.1 glucose/arabinose dehydrogenase [Rhizobium halophytocola]
MNGRKTTASLLVAATALTAVLVIGAPPRALAADPINAGERQPDDDKPFSAHKVAAFDTPWALAFLPDGRMLVTEKPGQMFVVTEAGKKTEIAGVPKVAASGQNGLLDVAPAPSFAEDHIVYITYVAPADGGSVLELARATLAETEGKAELSDLEVIWRQTPPGGGGQPGGIIAFSPDSKHLFLTSGDRMRPQKAQDPDQTPGKILRLNLDGSVPDDNPDAAKGGVPAMSWTTGHRNPYGLAFAPDGRLWEHEMGPRGGDEFNLIEQSKNYGWPEVSNGINYNGSPIPDHATRPEFAAPPLYWTPVIAPAGLVFYEGDLFPDWKGTALIGGLASTALVQVGFAADGQPDEIDRFDMGARIRDVAVGPDGAVWLIEDDSPGALLKLTPKAK